MVRAGYRLLRDCLLGSSDANLKEHTVGESDLGGYHFILVEWRARTEIGQKDHTFHRIHNRRSNFSRSPIKSEKIVSRPS